MLFRRWELRPAADGGACQRAVLPLSDPRAKHVARVLQLRDGDKLKVGVVDGGVDNAARVRWLWPEGSAGRWVQNEPRELRPGRLQAEDIQTALDREPVLPEALELTLLEAHNCTLSRPQVDLLLAPPAPARLKRLLPQIAQLGVGTIVLCETAGVDKWALRQCISSAQAVEDLLIGGLVQSGDTWLPQVRVLRTDLQRSLLSGELDERLPSDGGRGSQRLFVGAGGPRFFQVPRPEGVEPSCRMLVAVGPDGSWSETDAVALEKAGFARVSIGPRALTAEVATCAALALAAGTLRRWAAS